MSTGLVAADESMPSDPEKQIASILIAGAL
jgi:hypothetical protein